MPRPGLGRFWNSSSFLHEARATLADRSKYIQHGGADLQKQLPAMANDFARRLKQPPAHGLHLRAFPSLTERNAAEAQIQIVGQRADGEEHGVGLERAARHVFHAETDFQILDAVLAGVRRSVLLRPPASAFWHASVDKPTTTPAI